MEPVELVAAAVVLIVVLGAGTIVHELSHAFMLHALGISYTIDWLPGHDAAGASSLLGTWASVFPRSVPSDLEPWRLRVAALMPLTLATPMVLVLAGVIPDPLASGDPIVASATVGWLACALPSPQDFSLVWHAEHAIEQYAA